MGDMPISILERIEQKLDKIIMFFNINGVSPRTRMELEAQADRDMAEAMDRRGLTVVNGKLVEKKSVDC